MKLLIRRTNGHSTEIVDADRNGGPEDHPEALIVARTYQDDVLRLLLFSPDLLASVKELRDALAGAIRVIVKAGHGPQFAAEMDRIGVRGGAGVRADAAVKAAEGE